MANTFQYFMPLTVQLHPSWGVVIVFLLHTSNLIIARFASATISLCYPQCIIYPDFTSIQIFITIFDNMHLHRKAENKIGLLESIDYISGIFDNINHGSVIIIMSIIFNNINFA